MKVSGCANSRIKITESQFGISGHRLGVTLKLHGTSLIITNTHVTVCLSIYDHSSKNHRQVTKPKSDFLCNKYSKRKGLIALNNTGESSHHLDYFYA